MSSFFFFFNDTATTEIYTLSLHDALPIFTAALAALEAKHVALIDRVPRQGLAGQIAFLHPKACCGVLVELATPAEDRKSTRLNSSHDQISYAVFCLKKKKKKEQRDR